MKIDILCNDGSPLGVTERTINGEDGRMGVGGAELALLTLCRAWQFYGNDVTLYNDPREGGASCFEQRTISEFDPQADRDVLIIFRSPNHRSLNAKGYKVWFSCDQFTVSDFRSFASTVNKIVTISPRHSKYFKDMYGINSSIPIDLPVRTWEYKEPIQKIPKRCIFTSMPERGLMNLHAAWPLIIREVPDASLLITSDRRLWNDWADGSDTRHTRLAFGHHPNIIYKGAVKRHELVKIQMEADLHVYPCDYDELFCIAVAESQVAGAFPITSDCGSLPTTNMGTVIHGSPSDPKWIEVFVQKIVEALTQGNLPKKQEWVREVSMKRFSIETVLSQWDKKVFNKG